MTCLQDQKEFLPNEVFPDNFMRREVQAFVVNCTFEDEGCNWKGEVRHLEVQQMFNWVNCHALTYIPKIPTQRIFGPNK